MTKNCFHLNLSASNPPLGPVPGFGVLQVQRAQIHGPRPALTLEVGPAPTALLVSSDGQRGKVDRPWEGISVVLSCGRV